jgi:hypothetical protein
MAEMSDRVATLLEAHDERVVRNHFPDGKPDRGECTACGRADWLWGLEPITVRELSGDRGHDCLLLICAHCGFVRLHASAVLLSARP